jgi:hypothetical protein
VKVLPDAVVVEAGFDDDTPAEGARVTILNEAGSEIASGKADERGVCRLPRPGAGKYTTRVEHLAHHDEVPFEVFAAEFLDAPMEYVRARPNKAIGLVLGVGGLLGASLAFWWLRLRKPAS